MHNLKEYWQKISEIGVFPDISEDEKRRVRLLNRMNAIMMLMIILSVLPDLLKSGDYTVELVMFQSLGTIIRLSIFSFVFVLTKRRKYFAAKTLWFGFILILSIIPTYLMFNTGARIETFMLIVIPLVSMLLYKDRRVAYGSVIITLLAYYFIEWLSPETIIFLPESTKYLVYGFTAVTVVLLTDQLKLVNEKYENRLAEQKSAIERQNKEITDSIRYAKRIQEAILPSMPAMQQALKNSFVLYKPKDVVAGDFYWMEAPSSVSPGGAGLVYFAAADCTGHGVPGAMVSVVCSDALSKALLEENIIQTGKLLDKTREIVIKRLAKSGEEVKDGMDISLCAVDFSTNQLQWSGANNPLWIIRKGELIEYKHDKQAIGVQDNAKPFTTHTIELQKNDTLYIITDGYQDQFGGPKGKKFRPSQLKERLLAMQNQNMDDQKITLDREFENWKGENEQVDDVCIIGVRIS